MNYIKNRLIIVGKLRHNACSVQLPVQRHITYSLCCKKPSGEQSNENGLWRSRKLFSSKLYVSRRRFCSDKTNVDSLKVVRNSEADSIPVNNSRTHTNSYILLDTYDEVSGLQPLAGIHNVNDSRITQENNKVNSSTQENNQENSSSQDLTKDYKVDSNSVEFTEEKMYSTIEKDTGCLNNQVYMKHSSVSKANDDENPIKNIGDSSVATLPPKYNDHRKATIALAENVKEIDPESQLGLLNEIVDPTIVEGSITLADNVKGIDPESQRGLLNEIVDPTIVEVPSGDLPVSEREGDWSREMAWIKSQESTDVMAAPRDVAEIDLIAPEMKPTFNFAAYVNKSPTLQQMVKLGVDLSRWEKKKGVGQMVLGLDFDTHMRDHITFLHDTGVAAEDLGRWLTLNPMFFKQPLDDLQTRVNYLTVMGFKKDQVTRIVTRNPFWLLFSTVRIDNRLGFFQRNFSLTGDEVRTLATKRPRVITQNLMAIRKTSFSVKEEMGFTNDEMKSLLLSQPKLWSAHGVSLMRRFDYAHNTMGLSHHQLLQFPQVLLSRDFRLKQRHSFLKSLGRAQYDPKSPGYVSPQQLVAGDDTQFCSLVAKSAVQDFNDFLKTL